MISQLVIALSIVMMMIESLPEQQNSGEDGRWLDSGTPLTEDIEAACIAFFTMELVLFFGSYPRKLSTAFYSAETWINIVSILPFYAALFGASGGGDSLLAVRIVRMLRIMRVLRTLRLGSGRFSRVPSLMTGLIRAQQSLYMLLIMVLISACLFGALIYSFEKEDCDFNFATNLWIRSPNSTLPDRGQPTKFQSIPDAMWWSFGTMTGGGYGDVFPITKVGKAIASIAMMCSLIILAYPIAIVQGVFTKLKEENEDQADRYELKQQWYTAMVALGNKLMENQDGARPFTPVDCEDGFEGDPTQSPKQAKPEKPALRRADTFVRQSGGAQTDTRGKKLCDVDMRSDRDLLLHITQSIDALASLPARISAIEDRLDTLDNGPVTSFDPELAGGAVQPAGTSAKPRHYRQRGGVDACSP